MINLVNAFMKLFGGHFSDIAAGFTLLLAIIWFIYYDVAKLGRIRKSLKRVNKEVGMLKGRSLDNATQMDKKIDYHLHSAFRKTWALWFGDFKGMARKGRIPDLNEYFTQERIITIPAGRKKAEAVPGILIMIGILAAFLSIAGALPGLRLSASGAEGQDGLGMLTGVVTSAFGVCVAAIFLSILFQLLDRRFYQAAVSELGNFLYMFSMKILVTDDDGIFAGDLLYGQEVAACAETAATGIMPAITELNTTLERFSNEVLNMQNKGIQAITEAFMEKLNITIGGKFESIASNSQKILEYQLRTDRSVFTLIDQMNQNAELQKKAYSDIFSLIEAIGAYHKQAEAVNASLVTGAELIAKACERIAETAEADKTDKEAIAQERRSLQQEGRLYFENMEKQINRLMDDLNVQLDTAFSRFNDISSLSIEKLDNMLKVAMDDITGNLKSLIDSMDDQTRNINLYAKSLSEEVAELNETLESSAAVFSEQLNKGVTRTFDSFDSGLSEISMRFGNVISDIRDVVDELPVVMRSIAENSGSKQERPL